MSSLILTKTTQYPPVVAQSRIKRDWMDATYNKHAYQCLPMTYANVFGWELQLQQDVVVEWNGENVPPTIIEGGELNGRPIVHSSIIGMISFATGYAFGTEQNYDTLIGGSPNYFVDGASPLSAIIPSSWWPDEFQMNWKITEINKPVVFEAGMPFMFFTVFDNRVVPDIQITFDNLWDKPELMTARQKYGDAKMQNQKDNPWTWTKGIRTGLDADGNRIGPSFSGLPKLSDPSGGNNETR